jgi:hypothetical protein
MKHYRGRMTYGDYLVSLPWWHAPAIWVRRARRLVSDFLARVARVPESAPDSAADLGRRI